MRIAIVRKIDGVVIDVIETDESYDTIDGWTHLRQALTVDRIAQLQHCGICVDVDTEIFTAMA